MSPCLSWSQMKQRMAPHLTAEMALGHRVSLHLRKSYWHPVDKSHPMDLAELQLGKKLQHMENQPHPKDFIEPQLGRELLSSLSRVPPR